MSALQQGDGSSKRGIWVELAGNLCVEACFWALRKAAAMQGCNKVTYKYSGFLYSDEKLVSKGSKRWKAESSCLLPQGAAIAIAEAIARIT